MSFDDESTRHVSMWLCNDAVVYFRAKELAEDVPVDEQDFADLERYVRHTLRIAPEQSAAWHTSNALSNNDLDRVNWKEVASDLTTE